MEFEWDETKRLANLAKHGLDLMTGAALFDGRPVYSLPSPRSGEERFVTVGLLEEEVVAVVWARRVAAIRLISLRRARDAEKRAYRARFG
ncbi:MAG TPA: BrnT family toxin [Alphaproteobacteria bacterium]|nr:BrnT family toxin [Alphaproteobacteria bacterium]